MDLNETFLVTKESFVVNINNKKRRREVSAQQAGFKLVYHYFTLLHHCTLSMYMSST